MAGLVVDEIENTLVPGEGKKMRSGGTGLRGDTCVGDHDRVGILYGSLVSPAV